MEVRLNNRKVIKGMLDTTKQKLSMKFNELFSCEVAKRILMHYLTMFDQSYPVWIETDSKTYQALFLRFVADNPQLSLRKAIFILGCKVLADEIGVRGFRELISGFGKKKWYPIKKDLKGVTVSSCKSPFLQLFVQIAKMDAENSLACF
jgi:hypothetical protein